MTEANEEQETPGGRWSSLPRWEGHCREYRIDVGRASIGYVNAILEGHDELARVKTEHAEKGIVAILVPGEWDEIFHKVIEDVGRKVKLRYLPEKQSE